MTSCNCSYILFHINNVALHKWDEIIDKVTNQYLTTPYVKYVLLGKKRKTNEVMGLIEYTTYSPCHTVEELQCILSVGTIKIWLECNYFRHLSNFHNVLHRIATYEAKFIYEHHVQGERNYVRSKDVTLTGISRSEINDIFHSDSTDPEMILVIEERMKNIPRQFRQSCEVKKNKAMLSLLTRQQLALVHIVHPATMQCYHSFDFHHNPHYGIRKELLPMFKWILQMYDVQHKEYCGDIPYHSNNFITIYNNSMKYNFPVEELYRIMKAMKLKSRNISNYYLSYGYSSEYRSITGEPLLTVSIQDKRRESESLLPYILPILSYLSHNIVKHYPQVAPNNTRQLKYAQKMGSNFNYSIDDVNIYEGFDISIVYSKNVIQPHCDVMNDWRDGYNFLSVMKSTIYDEELGETVTISIICYTRKAIGDRMSTELFK